MKRYRTGDPWKYATVKMDGMFISVSDSLGTWTRYPSRVDLDWHPSSLAMRSTPYVWHCEAFVPGKPRESVKAAIRDRDPALQLVAFGLPALEGEVLENIEVLAHSYGVPFVRYLPERMCRVGFEVPRYTVPDYPEGQEGWVLCDGNLLNMRKVKRAETFDLRVKSWTPGRGKYRGMLGALICVNASGREVRVSGMSDEQRELWASDFGLMRGKIVEVEAQGVGSAGGLCHPRFVCVREDLSEPEDW